MLGKTSPKTVTLLLRLNPNTPEAMVVKYCRDRTISSANQMLQRAINAFYLPLAFLENGKLSLEVEQMVTDAIHEILAQIGYAQSVCLFPDREKYFSYRRPIEKKQFEYKEVCVALKAKSGTNDALVLDYCCHQKFNSTRKVVRRAINTFYLPQACLEARKPSLEVRHLALAAIHELQAQIRLLQSSCLPETLNLSSPTDCNRSNTSKSLIRSEVESSVSTSVARVNPSLETMMSEQDWSCC
ncbi:hypothetical protein [Chroococcidiopsis sp. CCNUC1]|uniref:hypothetical protein n=1 Tax=Chroococcidiopsis sp. CCNUC1 TaxID=2653189 RepID=UPI0020228BF6|nr:hypothetical protein [Chroococcidiopsis sp. CCNUC1]URD53791.1 hypothetical protein M5J74_32370 [Chroococcidiopsis sp. CCNUC1]